MTKEDLKGQLDGDELDLSMMSISEVPVKEIAAIPKAVKIDLSNNLLTSLPLSFASSLVHITKLELGSNKLKELPSNFHLLKNLRHLDLYNNQLQDLPVLLSLLKNLKWLDVKGNPLNKNLSKIAGDCLNQRECENAARDVLAYLKMAQIQMDKERSKKYKEEKDKETARLKLEEDEKNKKRAEKKASKEKRKQEARLIQEAEKPIVNGGQLTEKNYSALPKPTKMPSKVKKSSAGWSLLSWFNFLLLIGLIGASVAGLIIYTDGDLSIKSLKKAAPKISKNAADLADLTVEAFQKENLLKTANLVWETTIEVTELSMNKTTELGRVAWSKLESYTGDLSMYTDPALDALSHGWHLVMQNLVELYVWVTNTIDFEFIATAIKSAGQMIYDQYLIVCEELGKNEAIMSIVKSIKAQLIIAGEFLSSVWQVVYEKLRFFVDYVREEGPVIISSVKNQASGIVNNAKQSIEGLMK